MLAREAPLAFHNYRATLPFQDQVDESRLPVAIARSPRILFDSDGPEVLIGLPFPFDGIRKCHLQRVP